MSKYVVRFYDFYLSHTTASALVALAIFLVGAFGASKLSINSNQLDLLPENLPHVQDAKKITTMVGGTGFLIITLKNVDRNEGDKLVEQARQLKRSGDDAGAKELVKKANLEYAKTRKDDLVRAEVLKKASDEIAAELKKDPKVRFVQYKYSLDFIKRKFLFFWKTDDLSEAIRRVSLKRDDLQKRADPFFIDLGQGQVRLDLSDIISKYTKVGKKEIIDDYYVSPDRRMMVLLVKPAFSMNEIDSSRQLMAEISAHIEAMKFRDRGIEVGFTGLYPTYVDQYDSIDNSLRPTLLLSLAGIAAVLGFFIRRFRLILALLVSLVYAIVLTYGLTYFVIGKLNLITAIFGGILAGFGIDFGIHFVFRFKQEYWQSEDTMEAIKTTVLRTGPAALFSAATVAAAFVALILSEFKGFSEFGAISAYGIVVTMLSMFILTPLQIVMFEKWFPGFVKSLGKGSPEPDAYTPKFNVARVSRLVVIGSLILTVVFGILARGIAFDHDSRNMLSSDIPSEYLREEMDLRYDIAGDPLAVATDTIDEAASLYEYLDPPDERLQGTVAQIVSPFSFVPPAVQQMRNATLIQNFAAQTNVPAALIPPEFKQYYGQYLQITRERPFTLYDLPPKMRDQFQNVESSPIKGWLTFIYPEVDRMYFAQDLARLDNLVGEMHYPVIGRLTIQRIAYEIPNWERKLRKRFPGSDVKKRVQGMDLSEREINGVIEILNRIDEKSLKSLGFFDMVNQEILKSRPFKSLEDVQKTTRVARATGSTMLVAEFTYIIQRESRWIVIGTSVLVMFLLLVSFRNIKSCLIALVPLITGMLAMCGLMVIGNVKLNYFNIIVFPIIIGYGINSGIFMLFRSLELGSAVQALGRIGPPIMASNLTTFAGWGALLIAVHPGVRSMGFVACIGLAATLAVSLTFLPALIEFLVEKGWYRLGKST
ncbi:MAG: MMPL family transporter [Leptospirales bacterium]|nr:MMPL family transporter [Leptospirales bacterium]